jgi:hypothetical protein
MTMEPEENVTDASPSQTEPAEPDNGLGSSGDGTGDAPQNGAPQPPRWSDSQPAPAPWYVGRPGSGPQAPGQGGWGVMPPQQQPAPPQHPQPQSPPEAQPPADAPDSAAARGESGQPQDAGDQTPEAPIAPPPPPQSPYVPQPPPMPPWQDPNRYGQPQRPEPPQQQNDPWQRQRPPRQPAEQDKDKRAPLDLRTRWARGLALGAIACTMAAIWYSISNFPTWMIGAGAGLALGLVGLWLGVFAQRAALAKGKRAPEAVGAIVWSSIASLLSLMILAFSLIFYTQLSQLSNCMRSATTVAAQNQCETNFQNDFGTRS